MRGQRSALVAVGLVSGLVAFGCVKEDPIVTGKRDASAVSEADARPPVGLITPLADNPDEDAPDCRHCAETLNTDSARGTLCRKNGEPSSARRLNDVVDCVCYDKCVQDCASYCAGSKTDSKCQACIFTECITPLNACLGDPKP